MDIWILTCSFLTILLLSCVVLRFWLQRQLTQGASIPPYYKDNVEHKQFTVLQRRYFVAFFLALFSDWLQGPYIYKLYSSYGFRKSEIALLYVVGFASSAVFGTFTGVFADRFGRRKASLVFCTVYILCCLSKTSPDYNVLLLGRVFGGTATSMLFSTFESWYVYEHTVRHSFPAEWMSDTFSRATFGNGILAIVAGVVSNFFAETLGYGPVVPFILAIPDLLVCMLVIACTWPENHGSTKHDIVWSCMNGVRQMWTSEPILLLAAIQSMFESVMYFFVFMWTPVLDVDGRRDIPLGLVFACFMVSVMIGSSVYQTMSKVGKSPERLLLGSLVLSMFSMLLAFVATSDETGTTDVLLVYIAFIFFEVSVGLYFPAMGYLRSRVVPENHRTSITNLIRLPMNTITCVGLLWLHSEDAVYGPRCVFATCILFLAVACLVGFRFSSRITSSSMLDDTVITAI